jgi:hypothetical protein
VSRGVRRNALAKASERLPKERSSLLGVNENPAVAATHTASVSHHPYQHRWTSSPVMKYEHRAYNLIGSSETNRP